MSATHADANLYDIQKNFFLKCLKEHTDPSYTADEVDSFVQLMM